MSQPSVRIVWNEGTLGEWTGRFARLPCSTLTQCFGYAQAMAKTNGFLPRLGVIERDGEEIGLIQVLERRLLRVVQQRQIHRGPLWFADPPAGADLAEVLTHLRRACPDSLLQKLSFLPELSATDDNAEALRSAGFRKYGPGYQTVRLDLTRPAESLRSSFSTTWRQRLKSAIKAGLSVDADWEAKALPWLMAQEVEQAVSKHFRALPGPLAVRIRNALVRNDGALLVSATDGQGPVAAGLFFGHGRSATYQVGWSGEKGRKTHAMRLVLWTAIQELQGRGFLSLDLGGINPDTAQGVTEFKTAMGGERVETVGLYR